MNKITIDQGTIEARGREVKKHLIELIKDEKFIVKSITWEDTGCGPDETDMLITIECNILTEKQTSSVWADAIKKALKQEKKNVNN